MKSTVVVVNPTRVRLAVEVPFEELTASLDKAYKTLGKQIRVPGFRPGKVPARIIDQRVGRAAVLNEAVQDVIPQAYSEAVTSNNVRVVSNPDIELTSLEDGEQVTFTAEVDVRPDFDLPDPAELAVTVEENGELSEDDLENRLDSLRERFATLKNTDRPVADGDYVSIDLASTVDGEEIPAGSAAGLSYEVGSDELMPGLDEALIGMSADDAKTFSSPLEAGEHAGKTADVTVTVKSVKEKELPELNDDFAQIASEFDSLDELRDDLRNTFRYVKKIEQMTQVRDRTLEALLTAVELPLPQAMVDGETEWRQQRIVDELSSNQVSLEDYLRHSELSQEEFDADLRKAAEESVRAQLVLDAIADKEEISVTNEEVTERVVRQALQSGQEPRQYAEQVMRSGALAVVADEIRRNKALTFVLERAAITGADGEKIDVAALQKAVAERPTRTKAETPADESSEISSADDESAEPASTQDD